MIKIRDSIRAKVKSFDWAIKQASNDAVALTLQREKKRWLCRNDLFFLTCVTGHDKICQWKEIYQPFCDEVSLMTWKVVREKIQESSEDMLHWREVADTDDFCFQRLYLCYRAFYKTTVVTICHSMQLLLNFPDIHIVLCHNKQDTSSKNLMSIKSLFLNRPKLNKETKEMLFNEYGVLSANICELFPECLPDGKEWGSTEKFSLNNRTDWQRPEHNVEAKGVDTEITGGHWQVAKKNDLVTEKSVNTEDQIKKTDDWDQRFNKGHFDDFKQPLQDYEGTRYHYLDLYSKKLKDKKIKLVEIPIVKDLEAFKGGDDSQIMHPLRYKRHDIMRAMADDIWVFMCQLMLRPEDPAKKRFTPEMIHYHDYLPPNTWNCLLVDPADSVTKRSDYTAMSVIGLSAKHNYLLYTMRDKLAPDKKVELAADLADRFCVKEIGWEKIGLTSDIFYLREKLKEREISPLITEINRHNQNKNNRIRDILVPEYTNGKWLWPKRGEMMYFSEFHMKNIDMIEELEMELMQFPNGVHDDMLDTQAFLKYLKTVQRPDDAEILYEKKGMTFGDYAKIKEERLKKKRRYGWGNMDNRVRILAGR